MIEYLDDYWQNSLCLESRYLHDFVISEVFQEGVVEICARCHTKKFFRDENREYLSYHIKQVLQPNHPRYTHEYASNN